jgi:hypothetical protein
VGAAALRSLKDTCQHPTVKEVIPQIDLSRGARVWVESELSDLAPWGLGSHDPATLAQGVVHAKVKG